MFDKLFAGRNPPEEIIVIARLSEVKVLILEMLSITNIPNVKIVYKTNILKDCFKVSDLLNDIKFVNDCLKLLSKISINKIIENKK